MTHAEDNQSCPCMLHGKVIESAPKYMHICVQINTAYWYIELWGWCCSVEFPICHVVAHYSYHCYCCCHLSPDYVYHYDYYCSFSQYHYCHCSSSSYKCLMCVDILDSMVIVTLSSRLV